MYTEWAARKSVTEDHAHTFHSNVRKIMNMKTGNFFENIPEIMSQELFQTIEERDNVRVERIVSEGQATAAGEWYDQAWDEWVILLSGAAELLFDGDASPRPLKPGDYVMIPAGSRHRVEWTDPDQRTIWLAVHLLP